jgi:protein-tyrosine phosphatase
MSIYYSANVSPGQISSNQFEILYVGVSNQCRSAMAERITRYELTQLTQRSNDQGCQLRANSAGTQATNALTMHILAARALLVLGANPSKFVSRRVTPELLAKADLILTAKATERDEVIGRLPAVLDRAYTIGEFARLVDAISIDTFDWDPASQARDVVAKARKARGRVPFVEPEKDDILEPASNPGAFDRCAVDLRGKIRTILTALTGTRPEDAPGIRLVPRTAERTVARAVARAVVTVGG